jgi:hypothetical protein
MEVLARRPAIFIPESGTAGGRPVGLVVCYFIYLSTNPVAICNKPVNPSFKVSRGKKKASPLGGA